jgi:hypothetical protein
VERTRSEDVVDGRILLETERRDTERAGGSEAMELPAAAPRTLLLADGAGAGGVHAEECGATGLTADIPSHTDQCAPHVDR